MSETNKLADIGSNLHINNVKQTQYMDNRYDDIINLPHPESKRHPRMSREQRAAQFSPFAALHGHAEAINEADMEDIDSSFDVE